MNMFDQLGLTQPAPLSVSTLLINIFIGAILAYVLAWHFRRFGQTYSNRAELAQVLPLVVLATLLIISFVKSSLALSLGLVGALSIVRFRTPIKEPEELAYLFLAIAIGLGLGADQRVATVVAGVVIMGIIATRLKVLQKKDKHNLYMNVETPRSREEETFSKINGILGQHVSMANLQRLDVQNGTLQATYYIDCRDSESLVGLMDGLDKALPGTSISFVDQKGVLAR